MFSRAQVLAVVTIAALAVLVSVPVAAGGAARPARAAVSDWQRLHGLRVSIVLHRQRAQAFRVEAGLARWPASHVERRSRSVPFLRWVNGRWWLRQKEAGHALKRSTSTAAARYWICRVFGRAQCRTALDTAWRESRDETTAWNSSDHGGLFQLGTGERATYATIGYRSAFEQVVAARNLWRARGWEPWTCCVVG